MLRAPQAPEPALAGNEVPIAAPAQPTPAPTNTAHPAPGMALAVDPARQPPLQEQSPTPSAEPTPTPRPPGAPKRIGLQVGHWKSNELPDELARLRTSSGAFAAGRTEASVNLDIAQRVARLLEQRGFVVDIIPATVPVGYDADAFVAIHADGSRSAGTRGFKLATPWRTSRAAQHLADVLDAEYAGATGLPRDGGITFNMRGYYAFNYRRHQHSIARTTPAVIVEMGFLTNAADRALMIGRPDRVATGIANGVTRYLGEHDFSDGASLVPPEYKSQRALSPDGVDVRTAPRDNAPILLHAGAERRFNPLQERDGWYQVFVRDGERRLTGWVRKDQLAPTNDPTPTPPPSTDS
jgi:N-acetylmuramoyl-L-alanine amidase